MRKIIGSKHFVPNLCSEMGPSSDLTGLFSVCLPFVIILAANKVQCSASADFRFPTTF